ncbi:family 16 glycoside hydrolase [Bacteroidota bacterium]
MKKKNPIKKIAYLSLIIAAFIFHIGSFSQQGDIIPFNNENWMIFNGEIVEHLGRECLKGSAMLNNVEFENGVIEFDLAVNGDRSYPGLFFRVQSRANYEYIYIRPHIAHISTDALQYTPAINNVTCWQLYNGEGYTSGIDIPMNEWFHFKVEVSGSQAKVFINNFENSDLLITNLKHGISKGSITLNSPPDGSAYFSNFKYKIDNDLYFEPEEEERTPPGMITNWEISQSFKLSDIDAEKTPEEQDLDEMIWQKAACEASGLVNVSNYITRTDRQPDCIFARTIINKDITEIIELKFGYSDAVAIFLNGKLLYTGNSSYKSRDPSFLGIINLYDALFLELNEGKNELLLMVAEGFGGWGFMCQDGKAVYLEDNITKLWESEKEFSVSESVLYDPKRDVLYVSNFDQYNMGNPSVQQFISKVSLDGQIIDLQWIDSINNPLGMSIHKDQLYITERGNIAIIDLEKEKVIKRLQVDGSIFLNDIAVDKNGNIYVTDSRKDVIWKYDGNNFQEWLSGDEVGDPNVIYIHNNKVIWGNSGDRYLKEVNPNGDNIRNIVKLDKGFIDGIRIDNNGNYLVSLWRGIIYQITPEGEKKIIFDTSTPGDYCADFEYIKDKNLLIVPTFFGNTVVGYKL